MISAELVVSALVRGVSGVFLAIVLGAVLWAMTWWGITWLYFQNAVFVSGSFVLAQALVIWGRSGLWGCAGVVERREPTAM